MIYRSNRKIHWFRFLVVLAGGCVGGALLGLIPPDAIKEFISISVVVVGMAAYGLSVAMPSSHTS